MEAKTFIIETIGGAAYLRPADLAEKYGLSKQTVKRRKNEIEEEITRGRYKRQAIIEDGQLMLINEPVFLDYMANRRMLMQESARKHVPPFRASDWQEYLGYSRRPIKEWKEKYESDL